MNDILKAAFPLFVITLIAAFVLAFVYDITKEPIDAQRQSIKNTAMREILARALSFEPLEIPLQSADKITSLYAGLNEGESVGYIIGLSERGYSGLIDMLVAVDTSGIISGVKIINQTETPGLGARVVEAEFTDQFTGKSDFLADNDIHAITAATITSVAVTGGVNYALEFFNQNLAGGEDG